MPYKKLSEYQSKILYYKFINSNNTVEYININRQHIIQRDKHVIKLDNGTKRRMKNGLVKINKSHDECIDWVNFRNTDDNYIVEQPVDVTKEIYVMIRSNGSKNQIVINYSGGIDLDNPLTGALIYDIDINKDTITDELDMLDTNLVLVITNLYKFYCYYHFVFMEINPLGLTSNNEFVPLDFASLIDSTAIYLFNDEDKHIINMNYFTDNESCQEELNIRKLDERTGGSLKFSLINPNGKIWTLIAGGGASVVYTDAIINRGHIDELANYGEYSGDPQEDLVYLYCNNVFKCMAKANGDKILFIGGGIANFTDVAATFNGIIRSIKENVVAFNSTIVWVRRGGPNYKQGLSNISKTLEDLKIQHHVYGPEIPITQIVVSALPFKNSADTIDYTSIDIDFSKQIPKPSTSIFTKDTKAVIYGYHKNAIQRMLDFDWISNKTEYSVCAIVDPRVSRESMEPFFWGSNVVLLPLYKSLKSCEDKFDTVINFMSFRSIYESTLDILQYDINTIVIIAEGVPERLQCKLNSLARQKNIMIIGPATVGGIKSGDFRIANTGGSLENIIDSKLYTSGSVGFVTRSGGLLNELCSIISHNSDGVYQGISIGGDRHPGSFFIDHIINYQNDENVKIIVMLGEIGGIQELVVANAVSNGIITKPVIGWCIGTSAHHLNENIQFGHAGASATDKYESALFKNKYMQDKGIIVPKSFEQLSHAIKTVANDLNIQRNSTIEPRSIGSRNKPTFFSSISNELGDELTYNNVLISDVVSKGIGKTIGLLWLKKDLPDWLSEYIELILIITADHGGMVSGAHNTMVASRAGKDLISSLCSGLLTIGDYFGGALNDAGRQFNNAYINYTPDEFVKVMKCKNELIKGIGHKIKTKENPDKRVEILQKYVTANFTNHNILDYALKVEQITLQKRNNLILNVDGFIAVTLLDAFSTIMSSIEINEILDYGLLNGFFVLGRSIGFIGHWYDQKRLKQGLFRLNETDIEYIQ
jgi:ATP citrate (pro-S)-lyase